MNKNEFSFKDFESKTSLSNKWEDNNVLTLYSNYYLTFFEEDIKII